MTSPLSFQIFSPHKIGTWGMYFGLPPQSTMKVCKEVLQIMYRKTELKKSRNGVLISDESDYREWKNRHIALESQGYYMSSQLVENIKMYVQHLGYIGTLPIEEYIRRDELLDGEDLSISERREMWNRLIVHPETYLFFGRIGMSYEDAEIGLVKKKISDPAFEVIYKRILEEIRERRKPIANGVYRYPQSSPENRVLYAWGSDTEGVGIEGSTEDATTPLGRIDAERNLILGRPERNLKHTKGVVYLETALHKILRTS